MSIFKWVSSLFDPVSKTIDELHYSGEEKGAIENKRAELKNKLAEIEAKVATRTLDLQSQIIEANSKIAVSEQEHGNWLSKSWRPMCSLGSFAMLSLMGMGKIPANEFLMMIFGGFLGIYSGARSWEKKK